MKAQLVPEAVEALVSRYCNLLGVSQIWGVCRPLGDRTQMTNDRCEMTDWWLLTSERLACSVAKAVFR